MPSPRLMELRGLPSPVPAQITLGFDCWMAIDPILSVGWSSNSGVQFAPAFSVFHTPPDAAPITQVSGSLCTTSTEVTRPLMPAGPILRGFQFLNCSSETFCAATFKLPKRNTKISKRIKKGLNRQFKEWKADEVKSRPSSDLGRRSEGVHS